MVLLAHPDERREAMSHLPAILVLVMVASARPAAGAEGEVKPETKHVVVAGVGLRGDAVREDLLVPLTFSGPGLRVMLAYRGLVGRGVLAVSGDVGLSVLWNRYGHMGASLDHNLDAAWTWRVFRALGWHLELGPEIALDSRLNYIVSWDDAHAYWLGSQWLGPAFRALGRLRERWRWEARATFALLGFEGRPPAYRYRKIDVDPGITYFFTKPNSDERFVTLADLQVVRLDLAVRRAVYAGAGVGRGWSFGLEVRLARTGIPATNINLGACLYAARAWGL
jgi:hypothetical protein